jgi:predicted molibdopterin-dependent oxidoreductase YjgC
MLSSPVRGHYHKSLLELYKTLNAKLSILTTETNYPGVKLCGKANADLDQTVQAIESGKIKTLFVAGGDPVNVYPDRKRIVEAFKKLEFLIYWGAFKNATAELATLIFPAILPTEKSGSYLNIERRLQFMKKPYQHSRRVTSLVRLLTDIKTEIDAGLLYYSAGEVFSRITSELPEFKGLEYRKAEGTIIGGKELDNLKDNNDTSIQPPPDFPFALTFARSVYYGASGVTEMSATLKKLTPPQKLIINSDVARHANYEAGQRVILETQKGVNGEFDLTVCNDVEPGCILLSGYSIDNPPNTFMAGYNQPVYVRINKV